MADAAVRALHVLGSLNRGGAETWAVQLLECLDRRRVQMDILVHRREGAYAQRVRSLGAAVLFCEHPQRPLAYSPNLKRLLRENGPYHVVHSHLQLYSGLVLRAAHRAGVPGRIAHARNSDDGQGATIYRQAYRALMRHWLRRYATHLFAVSAAAAEGAFSKGAQQNGRCRLLTGIDFSPFQAEVGREDVRAELGISGEALVVGHVGGFRRQKNHHFLLQVAAPLLKLRHDTKFLLVGDGALRQPFEKEACSLGLRERFRLLGERNDVPRLLRAMDVFVLPSLYEGLPRVLLEAQAAGLPCLASRNVTPEAAAWPGSVRFLALDESPQLWAQAVGEAAQEPASAARGAAAVRRFEARGLSIAANAKELTELYEQIAGAGPRQNS